MLHLAFPSTAFSGTSGSFFWAVHDLPTQAAWLASLLQQPLAMLIVGLLKSNEFYPATVSVCSLQLLSSLADFMGVQGHQTKRKEPRPLKRPESSSLPRQQICSAFNLPISIFSTASCTVTSGEDMVFTKG